MVRRVDSRGLVGVGAKEIVFEGFGGGASGAMLVDRSCNAGLEVSQFVFWSISAWRFLWLTVLGVLFDGLLVCWRAGEVWELSCCMTSVLIAASAASERSCVFAISASISKSSKGNSSSSILFSFRTTCAASSFD